MVIRKRNIVNVKPFHFWKTCKILNPQTIVQNEKKNEICGAEY